MDACAFPELEAALVDGKIAAIHDNRCPLMCRMPAALDQVRTAPVRLFPREHARMTKINWDVRLGCYAPKWERHCRLKMQVVGLLYRVAIISCSVGYSWAAKKQRSTSFWPRDANDDSKPNPHPWKWTISQIERLRTWNWWNIWRRWVGMHAWVVVLQSGKGIVVAKCRSLGCCTEPLLFLAVWATRMQQRNSGPLRFGPQTQTPIRNQILIPENEQFHRSEGSAHEIGYIYDHIWFPYMMISEIHVSKGMYGVHMWSSHMKLIYAK